MTQESIVLSTTPPYPGLQMVQDTNKALEALGTNFAGPNDPAAFAKPFMTWADTGSLLLKRRNAAGTAWVTEDYLLMSMEDRRWASFPVGHMEPVRDDIAGVPIPPTDNPHFRYIKLTAGDAYNSGVLTGEVVSGSSPLIVATALIALAESPLNGKIVNLLNTEGRFLRPSVISGALQDSDNLNHTHAVTGVRRFSPGGPTAWVADGVAGNAVEGWSTNGSGGPESRPRNIGATMYMRVK